MSMMIQNSVAPLHPNVKDLTGRIFGYLTVIEPSHKDTHRNVHWFCRCVCGVVKPVKGLALRQHKTVSCGCKTGQLISKSKITHGQSKSRRTGVQSRTYGCWQNMCSRAASNDTLAARRYAKRDISLCEEWSSFQNFVADMGECPSIYHSIDRINNDGGYSKENCRWATQTQQQRNKSSNRMLEYKGVPMCASEFAEHTGIAYWRVTDCGRRGWTGQQIADAFLGKYGRVAK